MLKHLLDTVPINKHAQPPSGGCVLKHDEIFDVVFQRGNQPPSGGCVLKLV